MLAHRPGWATEPPVEELNDVLADPHEIDNLVDSAQHVGILDGLRGVLRRWVLKTRNSRLFHETEMYIRVEGLTP